MFVAGYMNPITNGPVHAVLQAVVAPEMQGRVFTLWQHCRADVTDRVVDRRPIV